MIITWPRNAPLPCVAKRAHSSRTENPSDGLHVNTLLGLPTALSPKQDFICGGGEIADLIRSRDWSKTALGPIELWPQSLRTTISLCLASNFPINIIWGPDAIQIYNVGYKLVLGSVHPHAIGESYRDTWRSAWSALGTPFERAWRGETSFLENQRMFVLRNGYLEETYFTFSLSPVRDETGQVVGIFHPVTETTHVMLNQRRTRLLRDLASEAANTVSLSKVVQRVAGTLADYRSDVPGVMIILEDHAGDFATVASAGDTNGFTEVARWPIQAAKESRGPFHFNDVITRFGNHACSGYNEPIQRACLLPIEIPGRSRPLGFLAVTLSTRLPFDESYMAFLDLMSAAVNLAVTNAIAFEQTNAELSYVQTNIIDLKEERHSQKQNEQLLRDSKFAAEAATRSKSAFLANMSHEIRTPLAAILGFTEILKGAEVVPSDRNKYLNIITRNGDALARIIDDILDLSKVEAGKINIEQDPLFIAELIQEVVEMFSDRAKGKGLKLHFDSRGLPQFKIESDAVRIRQILVNIVGNAIKFTSDGSVTVHGEYKLIDDGRYMIRLRVTDTGIGITKAQASGLFQAFNQADETTTRHYGGTGLGLALSKKLAAAMGGDVSIEKNEQDVRGTTFLIELAVLRDDRANEDCVPASKKSAGKASRRLKNWNILVVDDSRDNRDLLAILLQREGASVEVASSGGEAIRKAREFDFDAVLTDIQMPGLDGYEVLSILRGEHYKKPILALTAHTMKEERDRALAAGFTGHISKPVNSKLLVDTLVNLTRHIG